MTLMNELQNLLQEVGPDNIWRPIHDAEGNLVVTGFGYDNDGLPEDFPTNYFEGKTVVDLGCNLGYYTFLASKLGACKAVGIDIDERLIRGCNILKTIHGSSDVCFYSADLATYDAPEMFDIAMLLDTIGKRFVQTGVLKKFLEAMERLARDLIIISFRPFYRISKHFDVDAAALASMYPGEHIRDNRFHVLEYVQGYFEENWEVVYLSPEYYPEEQNKRTFIFARKGARLK